MKHEKFWADFFNAKAVNEKDDAKCLTFSSEANRQSIYRAILSVIDGKFENILDAGAGTGQIGELLKNSAASVTAMDVSYEMLKIIQQTNRPRPDPVALCQASVLNPPFQKNSFDLVIASEVLQYVPFFPSVQRLIALLKPAGILVISIPHQNHPAIQRAHRRRKGLFDGIGLNELSALQQMDTITFLFMPLFLCDDEQQHLRHGRIFSIPESENIESANRFIIKMHKRP